MQIAHYAQPTNTETDLNFLARLGVDAVIVWCDGVTATPDDYLSIKKRFEDSGLHVYGMNNKTVHNQDAITLGLDNRDQIIDDYIRHLKGLGKAQIRYTTYAHMANGIWSSPQEFIRGGARSRAFDLHNDPVGTWEVEDREFRFPLSHGRSYNNDEIWSNYEYFIRRVAPVAENEGVRVGIHPDDPPVHEMAGIPRCVFGTFDGFARAIDMADSPNVGVCFCVGCWLQGGKEMGKGLLDSIRHFSDLGKLFNVHLRNVNATLPHFVETFIDEGYGDMEAVVRTLSDVGFSGTVIPDHIPEMDEDPRVGVAYTVGYIKGLVKAVG